MIELEFFVYFSVHSVGGEDREKHGLSLPENIFELFAFAKEKFRLFVCFQFAEYKNKKRHFSNLSRYVITFHLAFSFQMETTWKVIVS